VRSNATIAKRQLSHNKIRDTGDDNRDRGVQEGPTLRTAAAQEEQKKKATGKVHDEETKRRPMQATRKGKTREGKGQVDAGMN